MITEDAVAQLTGRDVTSVRPSGSVSRVTFADGTEAVAKSGDVAAEAAGLRWLAEPGAVGVPAVLGACDALLVTEAVTSSRPSSADASAFGRGLARLHAAGAPAFGSPPPGGPVAAWIGGARMRNETGDSWPEWYAEHRVLPYAREAFSGSDLALVERACARLPEVAGPPEPPARLHGDLWTGNVLWGTTGRIQGSTPIGERSRTREHGAYVIDPAAHGGHRETDLAMLALFGCPQLEAVVEAYDEAAPLPPGWRERVPVHQLWPLLVHTVLFGGSYATSALRACERFPGL